MFIDLSNLFQLTGSYSIEVPDNITIASGRGTNGSLGAHIFTSDFEINQNENYQAAQPLFQVKGDNVRFSGIRFEGPFQEIGDLNNRKVKSCIRIRDGYENLTVDNCVFYGWPFTAIKIGGFQEHQSSYNINTIHNNYFFNNKQNGYGYGVYVDRGYAIIRGNLFKSNRHDIAGSGKGKCSYEAYCNTILPGGVGHNFDMHAEGTNDQSPNAGQYLNIHHNIFYDIGLDRWSTWNIQNIYIRGRQDIQGRIENNIFKQEDPGVAILQLNGHGGYGNMLVWNNIFNNKYKGWYLKKNWLKSNTDNFLNIISSNDIIMTPPASGSDYQFSYFFGDLDGDSETDIFKLENGKLYSIPLATSLTNLEDWTLLKEINYPATDLKFLFYNNDNYTDILYIGQNGFIKNNVSLLSGPIGTSSSWVGLFPIPSATLRLGDFDGNGEVDFFISENNQWKVIFNSNYIWQTINFSSYSPFGLRLGRFNNNNISDVLVKTGIKYRVSYEGTSSWTDIINSNYSISETLVADFNGNNLSDIINFNLGTILLNGYWQNGWQSLNTQNFPINSFTYGEF